MRRADREIDGIEALESIIHQAAVCHLAMCDEGSPYVIPLCFGYRDGHLYFHCAQEGRKLEILRKNNRVCFEMGIDQVLARSEEPFGCSMKYRCVIGSGRASLILDDDEKRAALDIIMSHYAEGTFVYPQSAIDKVLIMRVEIEEMAAKANV